MKNVIYFVLISCLPKYHLLEKIQLQIIITLKYVFQLVT